MRKVSIIETLLFIINLLLATPLLFSYLLAYVSPTQAPTLSLLNMGIPPLIIANGIFTLYWILKLKKKFLLSLCVLIIGYQHVNAFIQLSEKKTFLNNDVKIMSYNVRSFNAYKWSKKKHLNDTIFQFIKKKDPDILAIQEYFPLKKGEIELPYSYNKKNSTKSSVWLAIYSKHKIINKGSLNFKKSANNALFADIVVQEDTLRVYNVHLQSLRIDKNKENFGQKNSEKLITRFKNTFKKQVEQVNEITAHQKKSPYKTIITGDFNNTAFSWAYKQLKKDKNDAFIEAGSGLGKSFDYIFPFRIDFILADKRLKINHFKTYKTNHSDHYPIMARINMGS